MNNSGYFVLLLSLMQSLSAQVSTNTLNKVFHHKGTISNKISCYFAKEPVCNSVPQKGVTEKNGTWQRLHFLFPMTKIETTECLQMIKAISSKQEQSYSIAIHEVTAPIQGVLITVRYDTAVFGFEYEKFTSIQQQQGLVFTFYNKKVLQQLKNSAKPVTQYAGTEKKHIVIDGGHGASDKGKVGCFGICEKDINLAVSKKVAELLKKEGYKVSLTRKTDQFVALDERTTFANKKAKADLFVSIHANGGGPQATGVETYCSQPELFNKIIMTGMDDQTQKKVNELEKERYAQSCKLAQSVHNNVISHASSQFIIKDRKVKNSISQVLLGTDMPSALIEIGFLSNEVEAKLLSSGTYQELIAQGICKGIVSYINSSVS